MKIAWTDELKNELDEAFDDSGIVDNALSVQEVPASVRLNKDLFLKNEKFCFSSYSIDWKIKHISMVLCHVFKV